MDGPAAPRTAAMDTFGWGGEGGGGGTALWELEQNNEMQRKKIRNHWLGAYSTRVPFVPLCIVDASLSYYVGNWLFLCFKIIKCGSFNLALIVRQA